MRKIVADKTDPKNYNCFRKAVNSWKYIVKSAQDVVLFRYNNPEETLAEILDIISLISIEQNKNVPFDNSTREGMVLFDAKDITLIFYIIKIMATPEEGLIEPDGFQLRFTIQNNNQGFYNITKGFHLAHNPAILNADILKSLDVSDFLQIYSDLFPNFTELFLQGIVDADYQLQKDIDFN